MTVFHSEIVQQMLGQADDHLGVTTEGYKLHRGVIDAFQRLQLAASAAGINLQIASAHRDYNRQLSIWNAKASGTRTLLDDNGHPLVFETLSDRDKVYAILRWSALPGCSRHHWGTDMDVWDPSCVSADYDLQLVADEYCNNGPFFALTQWLTDNAHAFGFQRPYNYDHDSEQNSKRGVAPEPWHLSYMPVAVSFEEQLSLDVVEAHVRSSDILLKSVVLDHLEDIFDRFIKPPLLKN